MSRRGVFGALCVGGLVLLVVAIVNFNRVPSSTGSDTPIRGADVSAAAARPPVPVAQVSVASTNATQPQQAQTATASVVPAGKGGRVPGGHGSVRVKNHKGEIIDTPPELVWKREIAKRSRNLPNGDTEMTRLVEARQGKYPVQRIIEVTRNDEKTGKAVVVTSKAMVGDHLMVKLAEHATEDALTKLATSMGGGVRRKMQAPGLFLIEIPAERIDNFEVAMAALNQAPTVVRYAEPDYIAQALMTPNDTRYPELWGMHNTGQAGGQSSYDVTGSGVVDADIDAPEAWEKSTGSRDVLVGVIDTGIDRSHPDLVNNMWTNPGETGLDGDDNDKRTNGIDDDGNGYVDDWRGWDFVNDDNDPDDDHYHGTHCAGTIGGVGNNGVGVAGVCWNVSLVGLKFLSASGSGAISDAVEAIYYASALGVDLTSNSWGGGGFSQAAADAIADARARGILFVAAAGNSSLDNDVYSNYPSNYTNDNVIAVAATHRKDGLGSFSCYGLTTVDVGAPGVGIMSTSPDNTYRFLDGTSMATPLVSGMCALLKSYRPTLNFRDIKGAIMDSVDPISALAGKCVTGGRVNIHKALLAVEYLSATAGRFVDTEGDGVSGNGDGFYNPGERIGYFSTINNYGDSTATGVTVQVSISSNLYVTLVSTNALVIGELAAKTAIETTAPFLIALAPGMPTPYSAILTVTVSDGSGFTFVRDVTLRIYTSSTVSGRVTLDGAPLADVEIDYQGNPFSGTLTTDANGAYGIVLVDGNCVLSITHSNFAPMTTTLSLPPSHTNVNFNFLTAIVSGRVTDEFAGLGVTNATVAYTGPVWGSTMTDSNGLYSFSRVFAQQETLVLTVTAPGLLEATRSVVVPPSIGNVDFVLGVADIQVSPSNVTATVVRGAVVQRTLTIANTRTRPLVWTAQTGYNFVGVPMDWIDITDSDTTVPLPYNANMTFKGPYAFDFAFPFYGRLHNKLYVSQYGAVSFDSAVYEEYMPSPLPDRRSDPKYKKSLLAPFWGQFAFDGGSSPYRPGEPGSIYVKQVDPETYVIQLQNRVDDSSGISWNDGPWEPGSDVTAQAVIKADGTIRYQYKSPTWSYWDAFSIGIQNHDGSKGVTLRYNPPYSGTPAWGEIDNLPTFPGAYGLWGLAVESLPPLPPWLTISTTGGTINGLGSKDVTLNLNSGPAAVGTNTYNLCINSNDPDEPQTKVQITFVVEPPPVPSTIEAENYDAGVNGTTLADTTTGNAGGQYRNDDVDISGSAGNYYISNIAAGEWLDYTINVTNPALYEIGLRTAALNPGGILHVELNGVDTTGPVPIPVTGSWTNFATVYAYGIPLEVGQQTLRVYMDQGGFNLVSLTIQLARANTPPVVDAGTNQTIVFSGVQTPWTPSNLTVTAWYDGPDTNTITETGGAVSQWRDKSGNNYHVSGGTSKPVTGSRTVNGLNVLDFDNNDYLENSANITGQPYSYAVIAGVDNSGQDNTLFDANGSLRSLVRRTSANQLSIYAGAWGPAVAGPTTGNFLVSGAFNGASSEVRYNGGTAATGNPSTGNLTQGITIGNTASPSTSYDHDGVIGEIVIGSGVWSVSDRQKIEGYLAHKWGLTNSLPAGHPYKSTIPTTASVATSLAGAASDPDGDPISTTWSQFIGPAGVRFGDASSTNTTATFTAAGSYILHLTASDGREFAVDEVVINVDDDPVSNAAPVALAATVVTDEDTDVAITLRATDVDGDESLTYTVATSPTNGVLIGTAPNLTYRPDAGYYGSDSFTFSANDGVEDSNLATISITIRENNAPPYAYAGTNQTVLLGGTTPVPWTPADIALAVWYDSDDGSTIAELGGNVVQWNDKSGNMHHLTNAVGTPLNGATINGLNAIDFTSNMMESASNPFGATVNDALVMVVHKVDSMADGILFSLTGDGDAGGGKIWHAYAPWSNGRAYFDAGGDSFAYSLNAVYGVSTNDVVMSGFYGSVTEKRQKIYKNGALLASDTTMYPGITGGGIRVGGSSLYNIPYNPGEYVYYQDTTIGEFIVINGTVSNEDRQRLEGFLAHKWGLTADLPADHPYKSAIPMVGGPSAVADLTGSAGDADGDPITTGWSFVSGPAGVTFADASATNTTATFTETGTYILRFTADDTKDPASSDVQITVIDGPKGTITVTAGPHGAITPDGLVEVYAGDDQVFTIRPDLGYSIADVVVDASSIGITNSYTFTNVVTDHTMAASFVINQYTFTYLPGANGSIDGVQTQTLYHGETGTAVTPMADSGYHFFGWSDGSTANPRTDIGLWGDITVTAVFTTNAPPVVANAGSESVSETSASLQGILTTGETANAWLCWGRRDAGTTTGAWENVVSVDQVTEGVTFSNLVTSLARNTTYFYRWYAENTYGSDWSDTADTFSGTPKGGFAGGAPGLWFGTASGNINTTTPNPKSQILVNVASKTEDAIAASTTEIFTGYIFDLDGRLSFTENIDDKARIWIDGSLVINNDSALTRTSTVNLNLTPGWHAIEIRISNGSGASGPTSGIGIGYDPAGGTSWQTLVDPGDGSLLRTEAGAAIANSAPTAIGETTATFHGDLNALGTKYDVFVYYGLNNGATNAVAWGESAYVGSWTNVSTNVSYAVDSLLTGTRYAYTFMVSNAVSVVWASPSWTFMTLGDPALTHTIAASAGTGGSIVPKGAVVVEAGATQAFMLTPAAHYHVDDVEVDGASVGITNSYTFVNVVTGHTISASFALDQYTLTYLAGPNGSISGTATQTVDYGKNGTQVTAAADPACHFVNWSDGRTDNPRTDTGVTNNLTLTANFEIDLPPVVAVGAGPSSTTATSAVLRGVLTAGEAAQAWICWGVSDGGTVSTSVWANVVSMGTVTEGVAFSSLVTGLSTNRTYFYRCYASNSVGTAWSQPAATFSGRPSSVGGDIVLGWSYTNWTGDGDANISSNYIYTAKHSFGNNRSSATVNGVTFTEGNATSGTGWSIGGTATYWNGDDDAAVTGNSELLAQEFVYAANPRTVTLTGLTVGNAYEVSFYSVAFGAPGSRIQTFSATGGSSSNIDQHAYGDNMGIRIRYVYIATGTSQQFTITPVVSTSTFHLYALANREAGALATIANLAPTGISDSAATLNASLAAMGTNYDVTVYYGTSDGGTNATAWGTSAAVGSWTNAATNISYAASGLTGGQTYYYTFMASNATTNVWASPCWTFTTTGAAQSPTVTTNHAVPYVWLAARNAAWATNYEAAVLADQDGDGFATWQEYWSGTDPVDSNSFLRIDSVTLEGGNAVLKWQHAAVEAGIPPLAIQSTTNLQSGPWVYTGQKAPVNGTNTWSGAALPQQLFYRLAVTNAP